MKIHPAVPDAIRRRLVTFTGDQDHYLFEAAKKLVSDERMTAVWGRLRKNTETGIERLAKKGESKTLQRARLQAKDDFVDRDLEAYFDSVLCAYEDSFEATTEWGKMSQQERDKWKDELRLIEKRLRTHLARGPVPMSKELAREIQQASSNSKPQELKKPADANAQRKLFVMRLSDHLDNNFPAVPAAAITGPARVLFGEGANDSWVRRTLKDRHVKKRAPALRKK